MKLDYQTSAVADGVLFNWNVFPSTRLEAIQLLAPIGCLYTPLHRRPPHIRPIPQSDPSTAAAIPIRCDCENIINPYIKLDRTNGMWHCPFCGEKNFIPSSLIVPENGGEWPLPLQMLSSSIDYALPPDNETAHENFDLAYVMVVDLYQNIDEVSETPGTVNDSFEALKKSLCLVVNLLPLGTRLMLATFDKGVYLHRFESEVVAKPIAIDLNFINKDHLFDTIGVNRVLSLLGLVSSVPRNVAASPLVDKGFFIEINDTSKAAITDYITNIRPSLTSSYKPERATGLATYVISILLANASYAGLMAKVMMFIAGPCTEFPGNIINMKKSSTLRSHKDIVSLSVPEFMTSLKFYGVCSLIAAGMSIQNANLVIHSSKRQTDFNDDINAPKWTFDLFSGSLDQVGIYEMKSLAKNTMGNIYLYDSFGSDQFKSEILEIIKYGLESKYNAKLTVRTSAGLKVSRMIGHGHSLPSSYQREKFYDLHHQKISDQLTNFDSSSKKKNFTNQWLFNKLESTDTIVILFEPETARMGSELTVDGITELYIQFQVKYWDFNDSCWKLRVTTISRNTTLFYYAANKVKMSNNTYKLINTKSTLIKDKEVLASFNQQSFMVILTRMLLDKIDTTLGYEEFDNIITDVDKILIRLLYNWGGMTYKSLKSSNSNPYSNILSDIADKYEIKDIFKELPGLSYNLRRNPQLIKIFNSLPDETAYYHHWFLKMDGELSERVIQPALYELNGDDVKPISLDCQNVFNSPESCFIIMDSVFNIIIYKNDTSLKLHHSNNQSLVYNRDQSLEVPLKFISTLPSRPIAPKYVVTQKNHSQSRFLMARLNPVEDLTSSMQKLDTGIMGRLFGKKQVLTDDMSLEEYYNGLVESVKRYKIQDDI